jgi:hypothetical protein
MELKGSHEYPVAVDAVIAMLEDALATVEKYEGMGHRNVEIIELVPGDGTLRVVSSRVVDIELPGFAKKALKPTNTMTQTDEWRRNDDGSWSGTFVVDVKGAPVCICGRMSLSPVAAGTRHEVAIDLQVKVPIIGGKIADLVGKRDVQRTLDAEFVFNDGRLA